MADSPGGQFERWQVPLVALEFDESRQLLPDDVLEESFTLSVLLSNFAIYFDLVSLVYVDLVQRDLVASVHVFLG